MLLSPNQLQPVQQSRKHVLRSYCSNMYTVTVCVHLSLIPCRKGLISLSLITVRSQEIIRLQIKKTTHMEELKCHHQAFEEKRQI